VSIRFKVILPYLLLTLLIAASGAYVVTRLVTNSLSERLTNQLLESGRVVSDMVVRQEVKHVEAARLVAYVRGLGDALRDGDLDQISVLAGPAAGGTNLESLMLFDAQGRETIHLIKQSNGEVMDVSQPGRASTLPIVNGLLDEKDVNSLPRRELTTDPVDGRYFYFSALPVVSGDQVVGVAVVGTSLNTIIPSLKSISSSDVIIYDNTGRAIASSLGYNATDPLFLRTISISKTLYDEVVSQNDTVRGENFEVDGRWYSLGLSPLRIGNDRIAVFAVVLPLDYVVQSGSVSRNNYIFIYSAAMLAVILIGYLVARLIINPLSALVRTSRAIANGDLTKRTGITTNDEIGVLANTFDEMTENLQQRTLELEKTNRILEQMDRTKARFIQVAAHELRTPLMLVQGYAQMIQLKAKENPNFAKYSDGIMDGTERMVDIIDNMLDVSRIDSNLLEIKTADVHVCQLVERARTVFESSLKDRRVNFTVTDGLAHLPVIRADKELLYKVFYHVIMNAIKYTPDGGSITVDACTVNEVPGKPEIEVTISDNGIGIDPQYHELVFEKFYQTGEVLMHSSGKTKFKGGGPGLGLAIARGIVDAHGGRIWLKSAGHDETNRPGTKVFVRLPANGNKP
jgi:signal transduction histidine kinase